MDYSGLDLDQYHIIEKLGQGGMAVVYKAFDTKLDRYVAIKIVRMDIFGTAVHERLIKRFEREAKSLSRLEHPNIISIIDYGYWQGSPYLVMPFIPGGTLKERIGSPMPWKSAVSLLIPIADALAYAHAKGLIHRDVKPSNILLTESGLPMLTDFGIAKVIEDEEGQQTITGTGVGVGTPEYMAPEQGLGKQVDGRSDIYSLAVVLYELLTGNKPYKADTPLAVLLMQVNDPVPNPSKFNVKIPEQLEKVLYKSLAKQPANRYPEMKDLKASLSALIAENTSSRSRKSTKLEKKVTKPRSIVPEQAKAVAFTVDQITRDEKILDQKENTKPIHTHKSRSRIWPMTLFGLLLVTLSIGAWYGISSGKIMTNKATPTVSLSSMGPAQTDVLQNSKSLTPTATSSETATKALTNTATKTATKSSTFTATPTKTATRMVVTNTTVRPTPIPPTAVPPPPATEEPPPPTEEPPPPTEEPPPPTEEPEPPPTEDPGIVTREPTPTPP